MKFLRNYIPWLNVFKKTNAIHVYLILVPFPCFYTQGHTLTFWTSTFANCVEYLNFPMKSNKIMLPKRKHFIKGVKFKNIFFLLVTLICFQVLFFFFFFCSFIFVFLLFHNACTFKWQRNFYICCSGEIYIPDEDCLRARYCKETGSSMREISSFYRNRHW